MIDNKEKLKLLTKAVNECKKIQYKYKADGADEEMRISDPYAVGHGHGKKSFIEHDYIALKQISGPSERGNENDKTKFVEEFESLEVLDDKVTKIDQKFNPVSPFPDNFEITELYAVIDRKAINHEE